MRLMIAVIAAFWAGAALAAETASARLTVTGEGLVDSVPDMATITLGVTNEARTAAEAMSATSAAVTAILEQLAEDGLEGRDMQTRDLSLSPIWSNRASSTPNPPEMVGFRASNTVSIRVRELDALGGILDRTIRSGANTFQGLSFGLQDPVSAMDEARKAAVADALRKAELFAEAAGVTLGEIVELTETGIASGPIPMARMSIEAEAMPIAEGEVTTAASVSIVFEIGAAAE